MSHQSEVEFQKGNFKTNPLISLQFRALIASFFLLCTLLCAYLITHTDIGLDESLALPSDSHVKLYFDDIFEYLNLGPEVHFVFRRVLLFAF